MIKPASVNVAGRLESVSRTLRLSTEEVAEIVGTSPRTIRRWSTGNVTPHKESKQRFLELVAVGEAIGNVIRPEDASLWLFTPNRLLDYDRPSDRIAEGRWRDVIAVIEAMADGVVV